MRDGAEPELFGLVDSGAVDFGGFIAAIEEFDAVDAGFRGELQCIMINHDPRESITFKRGDRIAQLVFQKVERAEFIEVQELPGSGRGTGGFGSTGRA